MILGRQEFKDCFGADVLDVLKDLMSVNEGKAHWLIVQFGEDKMKPFVISDYNADTVTLTMEYSAPELLRHYKDLRNKWLGQV